MSGKRRCLPSPFAEEGARAERGWEADPSAGVAGACGAESIIG
jgi:hypothetical protein